MKNIDKYIENTKRKTKKAKLPALSTLTPVLPDAAAGIDSFNSSFGSMSEELTSSDTKRLQDELIKETKSFLLEKGFNEEELDKVAKFNFNETDYVFNANINADITISSLRELADTLYPIVEKYDEDAYFDISTGNGISVDVDMGKTITEKLHELDSRGMRIYNENYDFEALFESAKTRLTSKDRSKLQKFLQTTDDPEEVNTYMKGLLLDEAADDEPQAVVDEGILTEIYTHFNELQAWINRLTIDANKAGNDTLRRSADLAASALDDFESYLRDIEDDFKEYAYTNTKNKYSAQKYVDMFNENYQTEEEFEDATGLDYVEYNIFDVIFDWVADDIGNTSDENERIIEDITQEATDRIMKR